MSEQFLNAAEIGPSLEEVSGEGVAQEVGVDAARLQACDLGQPAQDQESPGPGQPAALRVQEELGAVPPVEVRAPAGEVAAERVDRRTADRHDAFLSALPRDPHEPVVEVDAAFLEPDSLGHPQAGAVEELDERPVTERARRDPVRGRDQALRLAG